MSQRKGARERREQPRIEKLNLVQVSRFDDDGSRVDLVVGRTLDISRGGVRLELHHTLPVGCEIRLTLALDDRIAEAGGAVAHVERLDADRSTVGIRFDNLSDDARDLLDRYLESLDENGS